MAMPNMMMPPRRYSRTKAPSRRAAPFPGRMTAPPPPVAAAPPMGQPAPMDNENLEATAGAGPMTPYMPDDVAMNTPMRRPPSTNILTSVRKMIKHNIARGKRLKK